MKNLVLTLLLSSFAVQYVQAEEMIGLKFNVMKKMIATAIVAKEQSLGIRAGLKDVTDYELNFVRENEVEFSAIAPGYTKEDGIPNYCSVVLARPDSYQDYAVKSVDCSPPD